MDAERHDARTSAPAAARQDEARPALTNADLMARLRFAPAEGRIWLDDQRMLLIHTSAMGVLRRELIEGLGIERARGLLTRMGYSSGARDGALARRLVSRGNVEEQFSVGPELHALEGIVAVEKVKLRINVEKGYYYGEYLWRHSSEAEEHVHLYGIGADPVCWRQIGYASGYTSEFMGRPILFREVECAGTGQDCCRIIGKPAEDWGDIDEDLRYLKSGGLAFETTTAVGGLTASGSAADTAAMFPEGEVVGVSTGFNTVCHMLDCVADTTATVLLLGESGVGKGVFARTLHRIGPRADKPFIAVNCAAIPETLVEAELFGVEKGAYTGATTSREGRFERANGGTLFLDEIGTMNFAAQGKLLRALHLGEIERVGGTKTLHVDVRVIAATNQDLKADVKAGRFREDLYFRLNVFPINVPPLRERREDIPVLMNYFLHKFCQRHHRNATGFTPRAIDALLSYELPGNIRELENMIERGVILARGQSAIDIPHLFTGGEQWDRSTLGVGGDGRVSAPAGSAADTADVVPEPMHRALQRIRKLLAGGAENEGFSLDEVHREIEDVVVNEAIERTGGNLSAAARALGITRSRLVYRVNSREEDKPADD
ncbi:MAG: sigma-54-dependent Fis family transcriptional regulator [Nevskiaceae bacterium]|nr:MAG: sigma-54-dependent Fis family transcriptional regulator [Nevskiaceae bacterium]TBR72675.1 MAG: sigma-54-dependent Fis family transcriptional regulator [Nevskiaceae bacterium]